jgi:hypothetical protein
VTSPKETYEMQVEWLLMQQKTLFNSLFPFWQNKQEYFTYGKYFQLCSSMFAIGTIEISVHSLALCPLVKFVTKMHVVDVLALALALMMSHK